jgi:hypothetical protein
LDCRLPHLKRVAPAPEPPSEGYEPAARLGSLPLERGENGVLDRRLSPREPSALGRHAQAFKFAQLLGDGADGTLNGTQPLLMLLQRVDTQQREAGVVEHEDLSWDRVGRSQQHLSLDAAVRSE